jgi:phage tail sheath protein FI
MALPDVIVKVLSAVSPRVQPVNTGQAFIAGETTRGPKVKPRLVHSLTDFVNVFGARIVNVPVYDWVDTFFSEGGSELYVSRVFGSGAKPAELILKDSAAAECAIVKAGSLGDEDPGLWGNGTEAGLSVVVTVVSGETYNVKILLNKVLVEETPTLETVADLVAWAKLNSNYIVAVASGASVKAPFTLAEKNLTGGTAGAGVADADYGLALERIPPELGPGQVALPGQGTAARQLVAIAHAVANNRFAMLDGTDTPTAATLVAQSQALYGAPNKGRRWYQLFAPWDIVPGLTAATTRTVPPSARACAQLAKVDAFGNPNRGAAGRRGTAVFAVDLSQPAWIESDRLLLNNAGVTISRRRFGNVIATWGIRTGADQLNDELWSMAPGVRTIMAYVAKASVAAEDSEFDQVDGFGHATGLLKSKLVEIALALFEEGALYGGVAAEAFSVNVGPTVNTAKTLAEGKLIAQVALRISPVAEQVVLYIIKVPITQSLAA